MSDCKWAGRDNPRVIVERHEDGCEDEGCGGCLPCPDRHCPVCSRVHAEGACAECLATTREALHDIARMCNALPEEVEHRGIDGEAMMLLGPATDPEAWGHREASARAGRINADYLDQAGDDKHPAFVLLSWQMIYRDALEHDEARDSTIATAVEYLDSNLTYAGGYEWVPFEDMARDLRQCAAHLERVLHDGEQVDRGVPCMDCGAPLERTWGKAPAEDGWQCPRCKQASTEAQYRFAVRADYVRHAPTLTVADMVTRTEVAASTIRRWASEAGGRPAELKSVGLDPNGRKVYRVADVEALRDIRAGDEVA